MATSTFSQFTPLTSTESVTETGTYVVGYKTVNGVSTEVRIPVGTTLYAGASAAGESAGAGAGSTSGTAAAEAVVDEKVDKSALLAPDGAAIVNTIRPETGAVEQDVNTAINNQSISLQKFNPKGDGTDDSAAFHYFAASIFSLSMALTPGQMLKAEIPPSPAGDWKVTGAILFNGSGVEYNITGNITQLSTDRTDTLVFAYDLNNQPAQSISRVRTIFQKDVVIDGNGPAMSFPYTPGDGTTDTSSVRFNYIDGLYATGFHATKGPINSCSVRQCRGVVEDFKATYSKGFAPYLGNGISVTTDWNAAGWSATNPFTWCDVVIRRCESYGACSVGIAAFNATNVRFEDSRSHDNLNGYSYEKQAGVDPTKFRGGSFVRCGAFNITAGVGFYVNDRGVTLDPNCWSRGITGVSGDTNKIFGNNVLVASASDSVIGGTHTDAENANIAIFGGTGIPLIVTVGAKLERAGTYNLYSRGASRLRVLSNTIADTAGSTGIYAKNTGGSGYWEGTTNPLGASVAILDSPYITNAGGSAFQADGVAEVYGISIRGPNNCSLNSANSGIAILIKNCVTIAQITGSVLPESAGKQGYLIVAESTVALLQENNNRGRATIARLLSNATSSEPFTVAGGSAGDVQTFRGQNTSGATGASISYTFAVSADSAFIGGRIRAIRTDTALGNSVPNAHKVAVGAYGAAGLVECANWNAYGIYIGNGATDPRSWLDVGKSFGIRPMKITATGVLDPDRSVFYVDATAGNVLLTLSDPRIMDGRFNEFIRIDGSGNTVSIQLDAAVITAGCTFSDGTTTARVLTRSTPIKLYAAATDKLWLIA